MIYPKAELFLGSLAAELEREREERRRLRDWAASRSSSVSTATVKSIDEFRADERYGGDGNRIDLAYAIYAFARGLGSGEVSAAIRSRDLSHKGNDRRQEEYVERTIKKALGAIERQVAGRGR